MKFFRELGAIFIFAGTVFKTLMRTKGNRKAIFDHMASVCFRTLSTVIFAGVFVGAILTLQFNQMLAQYDAQIFLGGLNTSAVVREVGPLIISFLLAGKIGAFTAAELGTMRVTEQIDAIEALGTDSVQYLVVPRYIAIVLSSVVLLVIGLIVSVAGAMLVASVFCGINPLQFAQSIPRFTNSWTLFSGLFKSTVYSFIVASVSCYQGFHASGGARGVGRAVTAAANLTNFYIAIANFFTSELLNSLHELGTSIGRWIS